MKTTAAMTASTHPGGTAGVAATLPRRQCRAEHCEMRIHVGVFFDGTGNNQDWVENPSVNWRKGLLKWWNDKPANRLTQLQQRADSNVARLFRAYPDQPQEGYFPIYIPGVGTPFAQIGEDQPEGLGAAFGAGGDGRINYGMLHVLNSMYRAISVAQRPFIDADTVKALCALGQAGRGRDGQALMLATERAALAPVGMDDKGGLLTDMAGGSLRPLFYAQQVQRLARSIANCPKPQLVEVLIDVFGFSRGAAQARAFCNWMEPLFSGSRLAGVTAHLRFVGLFDTVAAVGFGASATDFTDGHQSWGDTPNLRIPARVQHCEHYVAMHENRSAFALEDVRQQGQMPPRCRQYRFPGMHSDVGGGYGPRDQGRGPGARDSEKLSQIPLNHMFDAARQARVPLNKTLAREISGWDCYEIAPTLQAAYDAFLAHNGTGERPLKDCMMDYLAWRIALRERYASLPFARRASADDMQDLQGANQTLIDDLALINGLADTAARLKQARQQATLWNPRTKEIEALQSELARRQRQASRLSPHSHEVVQRARQWRAISRAEADLFANYCHDSYAGFKPFDENIALGVDAPGTWEVEGYLRYRTRYEGDDVRLAQLTPQATPMSEPQWA